MLRNGLKALGDSALGSLGDVIFETAVLGDAVARVVSNPQVQKLRVPTCMAAAVAGVALSVSALTPAKNFNDASTQAPIADFTEAERTADGRVVIKGATYDANGKAQLTSLGISSPEQAEKEGVFMGTLSSMPTRGERAQTLTDDQLKDANEKAKKACKKANDKEACIKVELDLYHKIAVVHAKFG